MRKQHSAATAKRKITKVSDFYSPYPAQERFHTSPATYRLFGGSKGPGKSYALLMEAILTCLRVPGVNVLIVRRKIPDLNKGILLYFDKYVPEEIYGGRKNYNRTEKAVKFPNGSRLFFSAAQHETDIHKFNGHEYGAIYLDESTEFTLYQFQYLIMQLRCPIKKDIRGDRFKPFMALGCNPAGIGHYWHKALFIGDKQADGSYVRTLATVKKVLPDIEAYDPKDYDFIPALLKDNEYYAEDTEEGIEYRKKLEMLPPHLREAMILGSWETTQGRYFSRFDPANNVRDTFEIERIIRHQKWHPKWVGIDWGYNDFCSVFWASAMTLTTELDGADRGEESKRDVTVIYRELVTKQTGEADLADMIWRMSCYQDDGGRKVQEPIECIYIGGDVNAKRGSANTIMQELGDRLQFNGLPYPQVADDDRVGGARLMDEMLSKGIKTEEGFIPTPDLLIASDCEHLINSIPMMQINPNNPNDVLKIKRDGDSSDDVYDGARYTLKSRLAPGDIPWQVTREKTLAGLPTNQARYMTDLQIREYQRRVGTGIRFRRPSRFPAPRRGY